MLKPLPISKTGLTPVTSALRSRGGLEEPESSRRYKSWDKAVKGRDGSGRNRHGL